MTGPLPTDPKELRQHAAAHTEIADIFLRLARFYERTREPTITITDCPASYEFRGDACCTEGASGSKATCSFSPLTPAEQAERDLAKYREARTRAERESRQ